MTNPAHLNFRKEAATLILSGEEIRRRLKNGEVFREGTWEEGALKEASYALRVAPDGLMLGGKPYRPGEDNVKGDIKIEPGEIAILSTVERLNMPGDLVGKIGIRFDYASLGLTGLMGIQVDPFFGWGHDDERLYIRVGNLGNESVCIPPRKEVFTFELHKLSDQAPEPAKPRIPMWHRIQEILSGQQKPSWSYVTRVQSELSEQATKLESETQSIRDNLQPVVMFGVFLVAVTILGVAVALLLQVPDPSEVKASPWLAKWEQTMLLVVLTVAALGTAWVGFTAGWRIFRPYRLNRAKSRKR